MAEQRAAGDQDVGPGGEAPATVSAVIPPSTSMFVVVGAPVGDDHRAELGDLRLHRGEVALAAEPGVDGHHEYQLDEVEDVGDGGRRGVAGFSATPATAPSSAMLPSVRCRCCARLGVDDQARAAGFDVPRRHHVGGEHHQWASNGTVTRSRTDAMMSGPNVRLGTNWPSITSHWMRSTPAFSSAATSSPSREKSAGSTDGAIWIGSAIAAEGTPARRCAVVTIRPWRVRTAARRFAAGGEAIARDDDGRVVFVRGALPGETVVAEITHEKRDWARGHVVDIVDASPDRVVPPCASRRAGCGGCGWQHLDHDAQRRAKVTIVEDALRRLGEIADPVSSSAQVSSPRVTARRFASPRA